MGLFDRFKKQENKNQKELLGKDGVTYLIDEFTGIITGIGSVPTGTTSFMIPDGAKSLSQEAARKITSATSLTIPGSFERFDMRDYMFLNASSTLNHITFSEGIKSICMNQAMIEKGSYNIPKSVTNLSLHTYEVSPDGKLIIGDNIHTAEDGFASHDCSINSVDISGNLKNIPAGAFNQCKNLNRVVIHNGVESCGQKNTFRGTNKLEYLEIPDSFNGEMDIFIEPRDGINTRNGRKYMYNLNTDSLNDRKLTIQVERNGKRYSFQVKREDLTRLSIQENTISFSLGDRIIETDIRTLDANAFHKVEGETIQSELKTTNLPKQPTRSSPIKQPPHQTHKAPNPTNPTSSQAGRSDSNNTPNQPSSRQSQNFLARSQVNLLRELVESLTDFGECDGSYRNCQEIIRNHFLGEPEKVKALSEDNKMILSIAMYYQSLYEQKEFGKESTITKNGEKIKNQMEKIGIVYSLEDTARKIRESNGDYMKKYNATYDAAEAKWHKNHNQEGYDAR